MTFAYKERVGTYGINSYGSKMVIIEYIKSSDIWVKFEQGEPIHTSWKAFIKGNVRNPYDKTVHGVGYIGESKHKPSINRKLTHKYMTWNDMLRRCYSEKWHEKYPSYKDCEVTEEWYNFQTFGDWYDENYYVIEGERMHLDKDILLKGNKIYSPDSVVFLPQRINTLFLKREVDRGQFPIGVSWNKRHKKYTATCGNGKRNAELIGLYDSPTEAFQAYKIYKEELIKHIANEYKSKIPDQLYIAMKNYIVEIND